MNNYLPLIRPSVIKQIEPIYTIQLIYDEKLNESIPDISFVSGQNEFKNVLVSDLENIGLKGSELVKGALNNLAEINISLKKTGDVLIADNEQFAAEKILDKHFLKELSKNLNSQQIIIAIPVHNCMIVCKNDKESIEKLKQLASQKLNSFDSEELTRIIFKFENDILLAIDKISKVYSKNEILTNLPNDFSYNKSRVDLFGNNYLLKVLFSCENPTSIQKGIFCIINNQLIESSRDKEFSGIIEFQGEPKKPKKDRDTELLIHEILTKIKSNSTIKDLVSRTTAEEIKISFLFGEDFQSGDIHNKILINLK